MSLDERWRCGDCGFVENTLRDTWCQNCGPCLAKRDTDPAPATNTAAERKNAPVITGVLDYFTNALFACAYYNEEVFGDPAIALMANLPARGTSAVDCRISINALRLLQLELTGELVDNPKVDEGTVLEFFDRFKEALLAVAGVSKAGNDQHNPGQPLHWARGKSMDQADCIGRHLLDRGTIDTDGHRHSAKVAWRALANQQVNIEEREKLPPSRGSK